MSVKNDNYSVSISNIHYLKSNYKSLSMFCLVNFHINKIHSLFRHFFPFKKLLVHFLCWNNNYCKKYPTEQNDGEPSFFVSHGFLKEALGRLHKKLLRQIRKQRTIKYRGIRIKIKICGLFFSGHPRITGYYEYILIETTISHCKSHFYTDLELSDFKTESFLGPLKI